MIANQIQISPLDYQINRLGILAKHSMVITSDVIEYRKEVVLKDEGDAYKHLIVSAEHITRQYLIGYVTRRIIAFSKHNKRPVLIRGLKNLLHHLQTTTNRRTREDFLYMVGRPKWVSILKQSIKKIGGDTDKAKLRSIIDMCERRGVRRIRKQSHD